MDIFPFYLIKTNISDKDMNNSPDEKFQMLNDVNIHRSKLKSKGCLEIILGPMFSGKTTRIIQAYKTYTFIGKKVTVINYIDDNRYHETLLSTHDKIMIPCVQSRTIREIWDPTNPENEISKSDVVLINEGQFFRDLYDCVLEMVEIHNKIVYVCGLDGDFQRGKFGQILDLIPYCDKVEKLTSLCSNCKDGTLALFSHRITREDSQIVIGSDNYIPLCRSCYLGN